MTSTLSADQLISSLGTKDHDGLPLNDSCINTILMGGDDQIFPLFSVTPEFDRSLSQSSLESQSSSVFILNDPSSNNTSVITTPNRTPKESAKASSTSYFTDDASEPSLIARYNAFYDSTPIYRVSSISCPEPPISCRPRPLTKADAKDEASFHSKIRVLYRKARWYEELVAGDPSPSMELQLDVWKKDLWLYHMRETFPASPLPISEILNLKPAWHCGEPMQVCFGFLILFLAFLIIFMLFGESSHH